MKPERGDVGSLQGRVTGEFTGRVVDAVEGYLS